MAADIPEGRWGTCVADGLIRLGAPPYGVITADVDGLVHSGTWIRKTGQIIKSLADMAGISLSQVDTASFNALDVAVPFNINVVISGQIDILRIAQRLTVACNAQAGINLLGQLFVTRINTDSPAITLNSEGKQLPAVLDLAELSTRPPYKRIVMGANRSWRVHSYDEIAVQAQLIDRGLYDEVTVYREGNIVDLADGSRWRFVGTEPAAGLTPSDAEPNWEKLVDATVVDFGNVTGTEQLEQDIDAATLAIIPDKTGFTYVNGTLSPVIQTITLSAQVKGVNTAVDWTTTPNIKSAAGSATFTVSNADMAGNDSVVVVATLGGEVKASHTIANIADGAATVGAPAGSPFADRTVDDVEQDISDAKSDIDDLFTTFGNTENSATNAAAAAADAAAADAARIAAETAQGEAETASAIAAANAKTVGLTPNAHFTDNLDKWYGGAGGEPLSNVIWKATEQGRSGVMVSAIATLARVYGEITPVDPTRHYQTKADLFHPVAEVRSHTGMACYDANEAFITIRWSAHAGSAGWFAANSEVLTSEGAGSTQFPVGTRAVRPVIQFNTDAVAGRSVRADFGFIEDVTESVKAEAQAIISAAEAVIATDEAAGASAASELSAEYSRLAGSYAETPGLAPNSRFTQGKESWYHGIGNPTPVETILDYETNYQGAAHALVNTTTRRDFAGRTFPIDPTRKYRAYARVYSNGQGGTIYLGFASMGPDGQTIGTNSGLSYAILANNATAAGWHDIESDIITGELPNSSTAFRLDATGARMIGLVNYNNTAGQIFAIAYLDMIDVTEVEEAKAQAAIAEAQAVITTDKASQASADRQLAANFAADSEASSNISEGQAVIATDQAAAASGSARFAASLASGHINPNSRFSDYPDGTNIPAGWTNWSGVVADKVRITGVGSSPYAVQCVAQADQSGGFLRNNLTEDQGSVKGGNWYVVEVEVTLGAGTFNGAGVYLLQRNGTTSSSSTVRISFTGEDAAGNPVGAGVVGQKYRFAHVFQAQSGADNFLLYAMNHWNLFGASNVNNGNANAGNISVYNRIHWHMLGGREANPAEIATQTVLPPLEARTTVNEAAIVDINGAAAFFERIVEASGSTPAIFKMLAGKNGSGMVLGGDAVYIVNDIDGQVVEVARFENGVARMNAALIRDLKVPPLPASEIFHPVQLKPLIFQAAHDEVVQYQGGASYGFVPDNIEVDIGGAGLPALAAGEAYDIRAVSVTDTQFKLKATKSTAGGPELQISASGTNVGGTPAWRTNKPTVENAKDGNYTFSYAATVAKFGSTQVLVNDENNPATWKYVSTYRSNVALYGLVGSTWTVLFSGNVDYIYSTTGSQTGHTATKTCPFFKTVNTAANLGSGSNRFGVHPSSGTSITSFGGVRYTTQTLGSETPVGGLFKVSVHPPTS